jgi:hypothetical protein
MKNFLLAASVLSILLMPGIGNKEAGAAVFFNGGENYTWSQGGRYKVIAWNDLGMHCMDNDYSVFAILPPYNNLHAQLIDRLTGKPVTSGVTITYQATVDTHGSINTTSKGKTNFWDWAYPLFRVDLKVNMGLAGNPVQSWKQAKMKYDSVAGYWKAEGIPTVPYDDTGKSKSI